MTRVSGPRGGGRLARSAGLVGLKPQATRPESKLNHDAEQILTKLPPIPA